MLIVQGVYFLINLFSYGVFRLTDPPGLQVITNCRQKPLFHQHPGEDDIYTVRQTENLSPSC